MTTPDPAPRDDVAALFVREGEHLVPTAFSVGPWRPDALHGSAVAALFGALLEEDGVTVARVTMDLLGAIRLRPLRVTMTEGGGGRRVRRRTATLHDGDKAVAQATALYMAGGVDRDTRVCPERTTTRATRATLHVGGIPHRVARLRESLHGAVHVRRAARRDVRLVSPRGPRPLRRVGDRTPIDLGGRGLHLRRHGVGPLHEALGLHEHRPHGESGPADGRGLGRADRGTIDRGPHRRRCPRRPSCTTRPGCSVAAPRPNSSRTSRPHDARAALMCSRPWSRRHDCPAAPALLTASATLATMVRVSPLLADRPGTTAATGSAP